MTKKKSPRKTPTKAAPFEEWAAETPTRKCSVCEDRESAELVREFIKLHRAGETRKTIHSLHRYLTANVKGFTMNYTTLLRHIRSCEDYPS